MPEAMVPANGIELCYETFGDADGEPLLLVNGLGSQMIRWPAELVHALVDRGFHVIVFDNRDVGRSTKLEDDEGKALHYLVSDMAADAVGLLDALGIDAAHVVGASMGGMIAQMIAIEHRSRVRTLTSIMSTTGELGYGQPTPDAMQMLLRPPADSREQAIANGIEMWKVIGSPEHFDEARTRDMVAASYDRCFCPAGTARQMMAVMASGDRAEGLRALDVPTLVVHGDADPLVSPSGGERTAELIPGATLVLVPGMGHDLALPILPPIVEAVTALAARTAASSA